MYNIKRSIPLFNPIFLFEIKIINVRIVNTSKIIIILRLNSCTLSVKKIGLYKIENISIGKPNANPISKTLLPIAFEIASL